MSELIVEGASEFALRQPDAHPMVITAKDGTPIFTVHEDGTWSGTVTSLDDLSRAVADLLRRDDRH